MKRKAGTLLMILGAVLVMLALSLFLRNQQEAENAQIASQEAVDLLWPVIEQRAQERVESGPEGYEMTMEILEEETETLTEENTALSSEEAVDKQETIEPEEEVFVPGGGMTVVEIDGNHYVGVLYIKALGLELPVLADLSDGALEIAPCRYSGTASTADLVIGAHNYMSHFAKIWRLQGGSEIVFTDMDGRTSYYEVAVVETISPTSNDYLVAGEYPLTLFTCTYTGNNRTVVRCVEIE